jgi:hypothetical protein
MNKRSFPRLAAAIVGVYVLVNGFGCSSDEDEPAQQKAEDESVVFEGGTSDEALDSITGATARADDGKAAHITAPASTDLLPRDLPPTFVWSAGTASVDPLPGRWPATFQDDVTDRSVLRRLLGPEARAFAHGDPYNGVAYYLVLSKGDEALVKVLTGATSYQPAAEAWTKVVASGGPITVRLVTARLENNLIASGGGPYEPTTHPTFALGE